MSERHDNKKLLELHDLSESEFSQLLKNYFQKKGLKVLKEKENDIILDNSQKIIVRFQRYQNLINASQIRAFRYRLNQSRIDKGYFITTSDFTRACQEEIESVPIELINGRKLLKMLKTQSLKEIRNA